VLGSWEDRGGCCVGELDLRVVVWDVGNSLRGYVLVSRDVSSLSHCNAAKLLCLAGG
jgi:hypothetical protein